MAAFGSFRVHRRHQAEALESIVADCRRQAEAIDDLRESVNGRLADMNDRWKDDMERLSAAG